MGGDTRLSLDVIYTAWCGTRWHSPANRGR